MPSSVASSSSRSRNDCWRGRSRLEASPPRSRDSPAAPRWAPPRNPRRPSPGACSARAAGRRRPVPRIRRGGDRRGRRRDAACVAGVRGLDLALDDGLREIAQQQPGDGGVPGALVAGRSRSARFWSMAKLGVALRKRPRVELVRAQFSARATSTSFSCAAARDRLPLGKTPSHSPACQAARTSRISKVRFHLAPCCCQYSSSSSDGSTARVLARSVVPAAHRCGR